MLYCNISTTTSGAACFDKKASPQLRPTIVRPKEGLERGMSNGDLVQGSFLCRTVDA